MIWRISRNIYAPEDAVRAAAFYLRLRWFDFHPPRLDGGFLLYKLV